VARKDWLWALLLASAWVALVRPGPLDLPYWWDEADVYVPGSQWVAEHNLDVTPGVFPDDYSRGHPILLYLLAGAAFRAFGPEPTVGHLVVLPFTALALAFTYLLGAQLAGRRVGFGAAALLASSPLFMAIGNMLLPELPLTALAALSLYAYARGRLGWAVLAGCAAVWVKETGVFSAAAIAGAELWMALPLAHHRWTERRSHLRGFAFACVPIGALVVFFLWQKAHAGYFIFPHHADLFVERPLGLSNLATVWPSLLGWHGRWIALTAAALLWGWAWLRGRGSARTWLGASEREAVVVAIVLLVLGNFVFFTKMFWLERYALPAHPGVAVLLAAALLRGPSPRLGTAALGLSLGVGLASLHAPTSSDAEEHTFAYADAIASHRRVYEPVLAHPDPTVLAPWPMQIELRSPYLGYVDRPVRTIHPRSWHGEAVDFVLFGAESRRAPELRALARRQGFVRLRSVRVGVAQPMELWGRAPEDRD